jgi:hypothetical protein
MTATKVLLEWRGEGGPYDDGAGGVVTGLAQHPFERERPG